MQPKCVVRHFNCIQANYICYEHHNGYGCIPVDSSVFVVVVVLGLLCSLLASSSLLGGIACSADKRPTTINCPAVIELYITLTHKISFVQ